MSDKEVGDGLAKLETSVRRAVELINQLRAERPRLEQRLAAQEKEIEALRQRLAALEPMEQELRRLRQERKEILSQVDAMLKELNKLDAST
jgi:uncharacterized protein involved in exopolysaccharide biosynthesis